MSVTKPPALTPVYEILTEQELKALRAAYNEAPAALADFARRTYNGVFPPGTGIFDAIVERFYTTGHPPEPPVSPLAQRDREIALIMLLAMRTGSTVQFAVHVYWGLMVGLEPAELGELLLLGGAYGGLDSYTSGLGTLSRTLGTLKQLAQAGQMAPLDVVRALSNPAVVPGT
jgi:alkylhydroperoxidase/carboxymuconolactone decarboxylase family protein YurZ